MGLETVNFFADTLLVEPIKKLARLLGFSEHGLLRICGCLVYVVII